MSLLCEAFHSSASKRYSGADQWSLLTQEGDQARRPVPDADGDGRLSGRALRAPRPARLRELLRPPPPRGRRQDRADPERALGSADDPESLRSRTVIVRSSDHGEMGLSHGGLFTY